MELRGLVIQNAKRKARKAREYLESLEQPLAETEAFINNGNENDSNLETKLTLLEQLKKEFQYLYEKRGEGAKFRSKLRWTEHTGREINKVLFQYGGKTF